MRHAALFAALLMIAPPAALAAQGEFGQPLIPPEPGQPGAEGFTDPRTLPQDAQPDELGEIETEESLLEKLAIAESEREARRLEGQLQRLWSRSGSATADLLFRRSAEALEEDETDIARQLLEKLTEIAPEFAEGWHQRAALEVQTSNFEGAVIALRHTLALQPKHFGALAELGSILEDFGEEERALTAYRSALEINPHIDGLTDHVRELERAVEGQGI